MPARTIFYDIKYLIMGCGASKIEGNAIALPAKFRPLFLRRLEEVRMHRRGIQPLKDSTPSKKELLSQDRDEEDAVSHNRLSLSGYDTSKTMPSSMEDSMKPIIKFEDLKRKDPTRPEDMGLNKDSGIANKCDTKQEVLNEDNLNRDAKNDPKEKATTDDKIKNVAKIEDTMSNADHSEDENDNYDSSRMIGHEDDEAFPGSPSFRIYFTDNREDENNDIGKNDAFRDAGSSEDIVSLKELPLKKKVKKGRKIRSFGKVLPKGGQAAVKNLLNVKYCYNSSHSSHDRTHLLAAKTTA